ncbi:MAG: hypothetical protein Q8J79_10060 [Erythrobacter sp.]|nr:hypothetical protein [Erythrobacter sp.]
MPDSSRQDLIVIGAMKGAQVATGQRPGAFRRCSTVMAVSSILGLPVRDRA